MSWVDILICDSIVFVTWIIFAVINISLPYIKVKKSKRKNYPFFSNCWIKKLFFIGTNEVIGPFLKIFTFLINIFIFLIIAFGIWWSIDPISVVAQYGFCISAGVYGVCFLVRVWIQLDNLH